MIPPMDLAMNLSMTRPAPPPPRVSIVMPSHNHGAYIGETIAAIQAQTFQDWELIVMDWNSTDATWQVLDGPDIADDPRIVTARHPEPGMGKALNEGFRRARGELLCWHQTDNVPYPDWLETMVREFDADPAVDFLYSDFENMDATGRTLEVLRYGPFDPDRLLSYCLVGPTFLYRRAVYETVGDYLESHPRDDHDYWVRVWQHGFVMKNIPVNLGANRLHGATRLCRMREEYDASLHDVIGPAIHAAQARGEEVFRVRDRSPQQVESVEDAWSRLRSRVRYFLDFFLHARPGALVAVAGLGVAEKMTLDILDELGARPVILEETGSRRSWLGVPVMPAREFAQGFAQAQGFDQAQGDGGFVLICRHDPEDAIASALQSQGLRRQQIIHLFLPPSETRGA